MAKKSKAITEADKLLKEAERLLKREKDAIFLTAHAAELTKKESHLSEIIYQFESHHTGLLAIQEEVKQLVDAFQKLRGAVASKDNLEQRREITERINALRKKANQIHRRIDVLETNYAKAKQLSAYVQELGHKADRLLKKANVDVGKMDQQIERQDRDLDRLMQELVASM